MENKKNRVDATLVFIDRCIHPITLYAGGIALISLAVLIVIAVIFRYVFNSPIFGTDDFNQIFLMATVAFSVPRRLENTPFPMVRMNFIFRARWSIRGMSDISSGGCGSLSKGVNDPRGNAV